MPIQGAILAPIIAEQPVFRVRHHIPATASYLDCHWKLCYTQGRSQYLLTRTEENGTHEHVSCADLGYSLSNQGMRRNAPRGFTTLGR